MNNRFQKKIKHTMTSKIGALILMVVFCIVAIQRVSGQQEVTATYDKTKREIVVENNTGRELVLFHTNDPALIKITDNQITYSSLTISSESNIDNEIKNCGLEFEAPAGNATHISKNAKVKTIPQIKKAPDAIICYVIEGQKISRKITVPVKSAGAEIDHMSLQLEKDNSGAAPKAESKKIETKAEPKKETKKVIINPYTDKVDVLITQCHTILQKRNLTENDRENLKNLIDKINNQKEKLEEYLIALREKKKDTKEKCEDCDVLIWSSEKLIVNIEKVKSKIINALRKVDDNVVLNWKKEYRRDVLPEETVIENDIKTLAEIEAEIEERSQHFLWGWIGKKVLKSKLDIIDARYREIVENSRNFIVEKQKQYEDEYDRAAVEDLANEIPEQYKEIMHYYENLDNIKIPYTSLLVSGILLLLFVFSIIYYLTTVLRNKKNKKRKIEMRNSEEGSLLVENDDLIEVISYKVGLSDVKEKAGIDYYEVNMLSIFEDTAIRNVYFSRKAILDIYKFFSGFLKYDDKTNETGCFLVGRWDYVPNSGEQIYDISIESLVEPGDDAIYGEYALNFGAKIGITLTYALESLCKKTGKEYVHTAWMHSHPGLGLFLSSQDLNVQSQLAYSQHHGRMLALVIDSNSPDFQMAFFSPKKTGVMNNDKDLKKTVALETLYQWAKSLPSAEQPTPKPAKYSYYNIDVINQIHKINKISLSASAIIDMDAAIMPGVYGMQGCLFGERQRNEIVVDEFKEGTSKEKDAFGCFLTVPRFTPPETMKEYLQLITDFDFALFYSFENKNIFILIKDEQGKYHNTGDKTPSASLMTMKEWTRRKR